MRDGQEQAAVGGALGGDTDGCRDVGLGLNVLARHGGDGQVDGGVGPGAVALLAVEVLDEGGEGVELAAGGVPAEEDLLGVCAQVEGEHLLLVVHVDLDLLGRLGVGDGIAVADLDLGAVLRSYSEQGSDHALLVGGSSQRVVEDGEDCLWLHSDCERGRRRLSADGGGAEGAGEMEERVFGHAGRCIVRLDGCSKGELSSWMPLNLSVPLVVVRSALSCRCAKWQARPNFSDKAPNFTQL